MTTTQPNELIYVTDDQEALAKFLNDAKTEIDKLKEIQAFDLFTTTAFKVPNKNIVIASIDEKYGHILLPSFPIKHENIKDIDSVVDFKFDEKYGKWLETYIERCRKVAFGEDAKYPCIIEDEEADALITVRYNCNIGVKLYKIEDIMYEVPKDIAFL